MVSVDCTFSGYVDPKPFWRLVTSFYVFWLKGLVTFIAGHTRQRQPLPLKKKRGQANTVPLLGF
jgi:hypothetical protein